MVITKGINFKTFFKLVAPHIVWLSLFMSGVAAMYHYEVIKIAIPWLPVSIIGTAVAFYVGFKNNQAYDRMWEARKIWGGIVNESRSWGMMVDSYISNLFRDQKLENTEIHHIKKRLIYRHIAWLYTHRSQLLVHTPWEHISQEGMMAKWTKKMEDRFGVGLIDDAGDRSNLKNFLSEEEHDRLTQHANTATQIINEQSRDLAKLREENLIDDFRNTQLEDLLRSFYTLQGKNERIKKFPLPRQYANMSRYFVGVFIFLLPFSMIPALQSADGWGIWLSIPLTALIGLVYILMELVGDYSENPFQRMANDIPMLSLCRTIEIDLREMLKETDLPPSIKANKGILM